MDEIRQAKEAVINALYQLPKKRQKEALTFYSKHSLEALSGELSRLAKEQAEDTIDYADRKGYGYGEVNYYLNEDVAEFAEDMPELKNEYSTLLYAYFELLIATKEI